MLFSELFKMEFSEELRKEIEKRSWKKLNEMFLAEI